MVSAIISLCQTGWKVYCLSSLGLQWRHQGGARWGMFPGYKTLYHCCRQLSYDHVGYKRINWIRATAIILLQITEPQWHHLWCARMCSFLMTSPMTYHNFCFLVSTSDIRLMSRARNLANANTSHVSSTHSNNSKFSAVFHTVESIHDISSGSYCQKY